MSRSMRATAREWAALSQRQDNGAWLCRLACSATLREASSLMNADARSVGACRFLPSWARGQAPGRDVMMRMLALAVAAALLGAALFMSDASAQNAKAVFGTWRLVSVITEQGGKETETFGPGA